MSFARIIKYEKDVFMETFIVVGLGNPGDEYKLTRHNIGFCVIDALKRDYGITTEKMKFDALVSDVVVNNKKIIFVKPQTYMNSSGESVFKVCQWYKISLDRLIIVYDDIDVNLGRLRIRPSGSAGSHNGLKSIISLLNSQDFPRVRVGIGKPPENWNLVNYVLGNFSQDEQNIVEKIIDSAKQSVKYIIEFGVDAAMNVFNTRK